MRRQGAGILFASGGEARRPWRSCYMSPHAVAEALGHEGVATWSEIGPLSGVCALMLPALRRHNMHT